MSGLGDNRIELTVPMRSTSRSWQNEGGRERPIHGPTLPYTITIVLLIVGVSLEPFIHSFNHHVLEGDLVANLEQSHLGIQ